MGALYFHTQTSCPSPQVSNSWNTKSVSQDEVKFSKHSKFKDINYHKLKSRHQRVSMTAAPTVCSQRHVPLDKKLDAHYPEVNWQQTIANHLSFSDEAWKCFAVVKLSPRNLFFLTPPQAEDLVWSLSLSFPEVKKQNKYLLSFLSGLFNLFLLYSICSICPRQSCLVVNSTIF